MRNPPDHSTVVADRRKELGQPTGRRMTRGISGIEAVGLPAIATYYEVALGIEGNVLCKSTSRAYLIQSATRKNKPTIFRDEPEKSAPIRRLPIGLHPTNLTASAENGVPRWSDTFATGMAVAACNRQCIGFLGSFRTLDLVPCITGQRQVGLISHHSVGFQSLEAGLQESFRRTLLSRLGDSPGCIQEPRLSPKRLIDPMTPACLLSSDLRTGR